MRQPLSRILYSALLVLAVGGVHAFANENQMPLAGPATMLPGPKVRCSPRGAPAEPLDPPATSAVPGQEKFVAGKHFKENISPGAEVRISWLGATFMRRFAAKVEDDTDDVTLQTYALSGPSGDTQIIAELDDHAETELADLWCLLERQANGEDGALQTDAVPNVFFVRDITGALGAVDAIWAGAGWEIEASQVNAKRQWPSGSRVISR